ncbi:glycosyltransferase [Candidatus Roizmanbacteria bacterium]|nr:glycosyltransferase [Candidatus Roizmanbacteria bacterium]
MKPFFSIIVPTLNEEHFLPLLLSDLERQKEKNFEVIIIDGASADKTEEIAKEFSKKLELSFFQVKKRNVSFQRNLGAQKSNGAFMVFLDADSSVSPYFTKKLHSYILRTKGLVFLPAIAPDEVNSQTKVVFNFTNFIVEMSQSIGRPFSSGGSMIFERNFFHFIGGFPENVFMSEDHQIIQKAYKHGVKARFMRGIKVKMSMRRMKKEGELKLLYKYVLTAAQYLIKGKIDKKIIEYQMGGHFYLQKEKNKSVEDKAQEYLNEAKRFFRKIFLQ